MNIPLSMEEDWRRDGWTGCECTECPCGRLAYEDQGVCDGCSRGAHGDPDDTDDSRDE